MASPVRELVKVEGIVQGVGFRPFVFNLAESLKLSGHVFNHSKGVDIELEGAREAIDAFKERLTAHPPPLAHITRISAAPKEALGEKGFYIKESQGAGAKTALVAPDSDVCPDCLRELFDPGDRRYRYPFINCTNCGPRFTIIHGIPYDRPNTTMSVFPMCDDCRAEYEDPRDRRFHAQPVACPACGPRLTFRDESFHPAGSEDPVADAARTIRKGGAVAVKGIGGYHLAVDAENEDAVLRLRERKRRDEKPFAVMFPDIDTLRGFARVGAAEASLLESRAHPITLVEKIDKDILPGAAPANRYIGAMVPYTPIHHLLMKEGPFTALVMTSANLSDDPIAYTDEDAQRRLDGIADAYLTHDRRIFARADDSIERPMDHGSVVLRRSRGYTPVPVMLDREYPPTLAVGGELKNTFCLIKGDRAFISQHIGDLKHESVYGSFQDTVKSFMKLMDMPKVEVVAHDMHPDYLSTEYALECGLAPALAVQHHHAHMVSLMAETHQGGEGLGIIFDGTGYGEDGAIWGGEFLAGGAGGYRRIGTVRPVPLPGGDKAVKEPWRIALAVLMRLYGDGLPRLPLPWLKDLDGMTIENVRRMISGRINTPLSHGMGRMFDAAAALSGIRHRISFEGQAAMELEMAIEKEAGEGYPVDIKNKDGLPELDMDPAFRALVEDLSAGAQTGAMAARFHEAVVSGSVAMAIKARDMAGLNNVFLSGGVFQNRYISGRLGEGLAKEGFSVFRHSRVPPNDGGVCLGQAVAAATRMLEGKEG